MSVLTNFKRIREWLMSKRLISGNGFLCCFITLLPLEYCDLLQAIFE